MLKLEKLTFSYPRRHEPVVDDFSLDLGEGGIYGLLGPNGAGKSTLLYLISGLLTPKSGRVTIKGIDSSRRLPETLSDIFIVPEELTLPAVRLDAYVKMNAPFYPRFSHEDLQRHLSTFEVNDIARYKLSSLSMGQKKKIFMCFALACNTSLLLMDEPTNGLDIPGKSQFRKFLASGMSEEKTIVISTHQIRDIDKVLDHVLIMDNSHVLLDESISGICNKLLFMESDDRELAKRALYALPSVQGNYLMLPNTEEAETEINLELLFGATLSVPEKIAEMFHPQMNEPR